MFQMVSRRDRSSDRLSSLCPLTTWKMVCRVMYSNSQIPPSCTMKWRRRKAYAGRSRQVYRVGKQWMMEFNVAKCKLPHAGRINWMKEYTMEGNILEKLQEKDIVVMVHKAMNGGRQVAEANQTNHHATRKLTQSCPCIQAWAPYLKKDINALEQARHRTTNMITLLRKLPYEQRLKECKLTMLEGRRKEGRPAGNAQDNARFGENPRRYSVPSLPELILYEGGTVWSYSRKYWDVNHAGTSSRNEWSFPGMHGLRR